MSKVQVDKLDLAYPSHVIVPPKVGQTQPTVIANGGMTVADKAAIAAMVALTTAGADPSTAAYGAWETAHFFMIHREEYFNGTLDVADPDEDDADMTNIGDQTDEDEDDEQD